MSAADPADDAERDAFERAPRWNSSSVSWRAEANKY
jgi:hypothetical protein